MSSKTNTNDSNVSTNIHLAEGFGKLQPLPNNGQILFTVGNDNRNIVRIFVNLEGDIEINTENHMGDTMFINPKATNAFCIKFISNEELKK